MQNDLRINLASSTTISGTKLQPMTKANHGPAIMPCRKFLAGTVQTQLPAATIKKL